MNAINPSVGEEEREACAAAKVHCLESRKGRYATHESTVFQRRRVWHVPDLEFPGLLRQIQTCGMRLYSVRPYDTPSERKRLP